MFSTKETGREKLNIKPFFSTITIETIDGGAKPSAPPGHLTQSRVI